MTALELGTPIIMLPTRAHLGEHQSDHQIGTAIRFGQKQGVTVADNEEDIIVKVDHLGESIGSAATIASQASSASIDFIRNFIYDA